MSRPLSSRRLLYELVAEWDNVHNDLSGPSFRKLLDEILFHADIRYKEYRPFPEEGPFPVRLWNWISNLPNEDQRKTLLLMLRRLIYIDALQPRALYRDAYRKIVVPWLTGPEVAI